VEVLRNKSFGVRRWQVCRVQDLGLPVRWNYLTIFSSEVSRLVLLSEMGERTVAYGEILLDALRATSL
jgi:hypothetical protein